MRRLLLRQTHLLDFAISSLLRKKWKNTSLLVLYTTIVFLMASLLFYVQALRHESRAILKDAPDLIVQRQTAGRHDLISESLVSDLASIRGVSRVTPRLWGYYYDPLFKANFTIMADPLSTLPPGDVRIGNGAARILRVTTGDMITLRTYRNEPLLLTVTETFPHESELVASDLLVMNGDDFRSLFDFPPGFVTDLAVTVRNEREQVTVATKIAERHPDLRPILKSEILRTYDTLFDWRSGIVTVLLLIAIISFVIFAWDKATGLSAEERKEIGILKSIGWETSDLLLLKSWEGAVVSLTSFLAGTILAYVHVFFLSAPLFTSVLKGWSVLYPQFRLTPAIDLTQVGTLFLLTVLPYTIATIIPSWYTATTDPDSAMRG